MSEIVNARAILARMLGADFEGADAYRRQLDAATLTRHGTGCRIVVDRSRAGPASYDEQFPSARLPVDAFGHGKLMVLLHGHEGYLDDLELLNAARFPEPVTVRIKVD
jgi:hypothetical protein